MKSVSVFASHWLQRLFSLLRISPSQAELPTPQLDASGDISKRMHAFRGQILGNFSTFSRDGQGHKTPPWADNGELEKAADAYQQMADSYPRGSSAYNNIGLVSAQLGRYEKAEEMTWKAQRLDPTSPLYYENLTVYSLALQKFDETPRIFDDAQARKIDTPGLRTIFTMSHFAPAIPQAWKNN